jgi:type IV pilus assembly protein PilQ
MNRSIAIPTTLRGLLLTALAVVAPGALAAEAANTLQAVDVQPLGTQGVQVVLTTSGPAPQPNAFAIENPARISLDLAGTTLGLPSRRIVVGTNGLDSVLAAEADGRTRLVLNLERMQAYNTRVDGNRIILTLGETVAGAAPAAAAAASAPAAAAPRLSRGIQNIDFRRGSDSSGSGRVIVRLGDPRTPVNVRQQGNQILVDFVGADLPAQLRRRLDVTDFATPVVTIDAVGTPNGTQLAITSSGDFEQLAYQAEDQYVIEVQPRRTPRVAVAERAVYSGERMHASFQDIPTRTLLLLIGDVAGKNMVINASVGGSVTLSLNNVPWDQALDIVMQLKGLDKRVNDNVIIVGPTAELANRDKAQMEARKEIQELAPLRTELVQINFGKAADIASLLRSTGGGEGTSLLSARGSLTVHNPSNSLLIQDTAESISAVRDLVSQLDIPVRQVRIEARIVAVSEDFTRDLGVRFGATGIQTTGDGFISTTGNSIANEDILGSGGAPFPGGAPFAPSRYNVNLPAPSPAGAISFLVLGSDYLVDLELSAAQSEGNGEVISSPSLTVTNQQEAVIQQGSEIPYQEAASSGATSVSFKDVKTSLTVTPVITPDNRLILDIAVQRESVGQLVVGIGGGQIPSINSSDIRTRVVVNDGQTVVLGGILETERRETVKKVPLLGDVPIFGHLFKSTSRVNNKDELLIFVTPKIIREGASAR